MSSQPSSLHALIGGEGIGKTWALLDWWDRTAGEEGTGQPLTIWLRAADIRHGDIEGTMASALQRRSGLRDEAFWMRRLRRWLSGEGRRILLLIDGLNQNFTFRDWSDALQGFFAPPWLDRIAIVVTCRPDFWDGLMKLRDLAPAPIEVEVGPFTDTELDAVLEPQGAKRSSFAGPLLDLMRVPRLFSLALRHPDLFPNMNELTPEQLVLADWRDRVGRYGNRAGLDDDEFRALAARLGQRLRGAIAAGGSAARLTRRELINELERDTGPGHPGIGAAISELIDGRWLPRRGRHEMVLDAAVAPIALGLSLLHVLEDEAHDASIDDVISDFLDPLRGADLEPAVLRAAVTAAMIEGSAAPPVQRGLVSRWLTSQNFSRRDFAGLWPLIRLDPTVFLDVAEEGWRSGRFERLRDDFLAKAFANACRSPNVMAALDERLRSWLGTVRPAPTAEPGDWSIALGERPQSPAALVGHFQQLLGPTVAGASLLHLEDENGSAAALMPHALAICSFCRRAGMVDAFVAWALAGAAMGVWPSAAFLAWVLRIDGGDAAETGILILQACRSILATNVAEARPAVGVLLAALATPEASQLAESLGVPLFTTPAPAVGTKWPGVVPHVLFTGPTDDTLDRAGTMATSRDATLTDVEIDLLSDLLERMPSAEFVSRIKSAGLRGPLPVVARWLPEKFGQLFRGVGDAAVAAPGERCPDWLKPIREDGSFLAVFMEARSRTGLAAVLRRPPLPFTPAWRPGLDCVALGLYGLSPGEQVIHLAAVAPLLLPEAAHSVLNPLPQDGIERELQPNPAGPEGAAILEFWLRNLNLSLWLDDRAEPPALGVRHINDPDVRVRIAAAGLVNASRRPEEAAAAFAYSGWRWEPSMSSDEAAQGSILLLHAKASRGKDILGRADPQIAVAAFQEDVLEAPGLARFLRDEIDHVIKRDVEFSTNRYWCRRDKVRDFVAACPDEAAQLVAPALAASRARATFLFMGFPILELCAGLLRHRPEVGAALWKSLRDEERDGITKNGQLHLMPLEVERSPAMDALREMSLVAAVDDHVLAGIANKATRSGDGWLEETIRRDLGSHCAVTIARAITLAGFMHDTLAARALWSGPLAISPALGWLAVVHASAAASFRRHLDAMHWLELALAASDPHRAAALHLLFLSAADARSIFAGQERVERARPQMHRSLIVQWNLGLRKFEQQENRTDDRLGKLMCGTPISTRVAPWA